MPGKRSAEHFFEKSFHCWVVTPQIQARAVPVLKGNTEKAPPPAENIFFYSAVRKNRK
jgi:hypothetical protein